MSPGPPPKPEDERVRRADPAFPWRDLPARLACASAGCGEAPAIGLTSRSGTRWLCRDHAAAAEREVRAAGYDMEPLDVALARAAEAAAAPWRADL